MGQLGALGWPVVPEVYKITAVSSPALLAQPDRLVRFVPAQRRTRRDGNDHLGACRACRLGSFLGEEREDHATLASQSFQTKEISPALSSGFIGTAMAPIAQDRVVDDREIGHVRHDHRNSIARREHRER